MTTYSKGFVDNLWKASYGVAFCEPIRKRDEKLFHSITCTFCREKFWVSKDLKVIPEACEKCFRTRLEGAPRKVKPRSPLEI